MSCQKKIVETITEKKADYVIGLKQNQPALYKDTEDYFSEYYKELPSTTTLDKGHGRIEKREYRLLTDLSWLEQRSEWIGLKALGSVKAIPHKDHFLDFVRILLACFPPYCTKTP